MPCIASMFYQLEVVVLISQNVSVSPGNGGIWKKNKDA